MWDDIEYKWGFWEKIGDWFYWNWVMVITVLMIAALIGIPVGLGLHHKFSPKEIITHNILCIQVSEKGFWNNGTEYFDDRDGYIWKILSNGNIEVFKNSKTVAYYNHILGFKIISIEKEYPINK
jgi:hypothetical protein